MKKITGYVVLVIAAALLVGITLQRDAAAQRAPQPQAPPPRFPQSANLARWEYATLRYDIANDRWVWTTPDDVKRGDKRRLFKEMDGYGKRDEHEISYVDLATQAGLYGWELTTVLEREKGTEIWFKRPVR